MAGWVTTTASRTSGAALALVIGACGGAGGGSVGTAQDLATVGLSGVVAARTSQAGEFAADYLRGTHFTSLVVEVGYPAGRAPSLAVLDLLRDRLTERCSKADGVVVEVGEAIPAEEFPEPVSEGDLAHLEDAHRRRYSDAPSKVAAMYVLLVSGHDVKDEGMARVVGTSYRGGSLAVFMDTADQGSNLFVTTDEMLGTALVHEVGHLLGLVNHGVPMVVDHDDKDHHGHDTDPKSVMFWYVQVPRVKPNLGDPDFAQYGAACIADLQAFGGR